MKKITFIALIICFAFWGALSTMQLKRELRLA